MKLLRVDSSARSTSVTRALTAKFVEAWKQEHPTGKVTYRDLAAEPLPPPISAEWSAASNADAATLTPSQWHVLALSDELIAELEAADVIVLGAPMYNFAISAPLKAWIDHVVRQGKTVDFTQRPPKPLLRGKKLVVITARGGSYVAGTPTAAFDFQEPYLRHVLGLIGLNDVTYIHADRQLYGPEAADVSQREATERIYEVVGELATASAA